MDEKIRNKSKKIDISKAVMLCIIFLLIGYIIGWSMGYSSALGWCVERGMAILRLNKIEIDVPEGLIQAALFRYKGHIDKMFPLNKSLLDDDN